MPFHGCLCPECDWLYGYDGILPNGKKVVCGKCQQGEAKIKEIEDVLEAQRRLREDGKEITAKSVSDELFDMYAERRKAEREAEELATYKRLRRKYQREAYAKRKAKCR